MNKIIAYLKRKKVQLRVQGKTKYFCIGRNKTGTTSIKRAFEDLGFALGDEMRATRLADKYYFSGKFQPIVDFCSSAQVFQDAPFSWSETYKYVDVGYPDSKFILTVRDNAEQWYSSLVQFHSKIYGNGKVPTALDLEEGAKRLSRPVNVMRVHGTSQGDPYNKNIMVAHYEEYNKSVIEYFKNRPDDLLVINISEGGSYQKFIDFLQVDSPYDAFPWENKT